MCARLHEQLTVDRPADPRHLLDGESVVLQFGLIGPDGSIRLSSAAPVPPGQTVKDRDYFQNQVNAATDELFISAPAVGRISKHLLIQLARRMTAPDGSFDGLIVARLLSASPSRLRAALIASIVALGGRKPRLWP